MVEYPSNSNNSNGSNGKKGLTKKEEKKPTVYQTIKPKIIFLNTMLEKNKGEEFEDTVLYTKDWVILKKHKIKFFSTMNEIIEAYWHWIDSQKLSFRTDKFFSLCEKAYESKVSFNTFYKGFKNLEKKIPRAYAIIMNETEDKVLLIKNFAPNQHKMTERGWSLSGGKVEFSETFEDCLERELKEELNIVVSKEDLENFRNFRNFQRDFKIFMLTMKEEDIVNCKPSNPFEIEEFAWFSLDNLPPLVCIASHSLKLFGLPAQCKCELCR